jgi:hypothetical protein
MVLPETATQDFNVPEQIVAIYFKTDMKSEPITCIEITNAIHDLILLEIQHLEATNDNRQINANDFSDRREMLRRTILDGLQQHSAAKGVYVK